MVILNKSIFIGWKKLVGIPWLRIASVQILNLLRWTVRVERMRRARKHRARNISLLIPSKVVYSTINCLDLKFLVPFLPFLAVMTCREFRFFGVAWSVHGPSVELKSFLKLSWETSNQELSFWPRLGLVSFHGRANEQRNMCKELRKI